MFEQLLQRAERRARRAAAQRQEAMIQRLRAETPQDVALAADADGIVLSGCGLGRRMAFDPALRWLLMEAGR